MAKQELYRVFIDRLESARDKRNFFESSWYSFAVLEDRLCSLLNSSGGLLFTSGKAAGKPIKMMGPKLGELKARRDSGMTILVQFTDALHDDLDKWKDERNNLMHAMAAATLSIVDIDSKIEKLAIDGALLVRRYCALCRRVKKKLP